MKKLILPLFILISTLSDAQWQQVNGPGGGQVTCSFYNGTELFVGTFEGSLYKSDPDGNNRHQILPVNTDVNFDKVVKLGNRIYVHYSMPLPPAYSDDNGVSWNTDTTDERPTYKEGIFFRNHTFSLDSGNTWINNSVMGNYDYGFRNGNETFLSGPGNLFRTFNNGLTWDTLLITPVTGSIIKSGSNFISTSGEISNDSGLTWNAISTFSGKTIKQIEHDNFSVYALTDTSGLFFSQDYGLTWTQVSNGIPINTSLNLLMADETNVFVTGYNDGIFSSVDHGISWHNVNQNLNSLSTNFITSKDSMLFAATTCGLFSSIDLGLNWNKVDVSPIANSSPVTDVFIDNGDIFITCKKEIYLSQDNGNTWTSLNIGTLFYDQYCMAANDSFIFSSGSNGLYISSDRGNTWSLRSTEYSYSSNTIVVLNQNIFLVQWDSLAISNDNGFTWRKAPNITMPISRVIKNQNKIYVCSEIDGVLCSTDSGTSWTKIIDRSYLMNLYVNDSIIWAPQVLYNIYYSFDGGQTLDSIRTPDHFFDSKGFHSYSGSIYAGMSTGGIWTTPFLNPTNSIKENNKNVLNLFPNPARNNISIETNNKTGPFIYYITDSSGRKVKKGITFGTVDISFLKVGEYYFSTDETHHSAIKFLKVN